MALAANYFRVQEYGNAVVGEKVQTVYDAETGMVGQKKPQWHKYQPVTVELHSCMQNKYKLDKL